VPKIHFRAQLSTECLEVIVIDGCSRDSTVEKAKDYPVKIFREPLNAPAAYNYALKIVDNELIGLWTQTRSGKRVAEQTNPHFDNPQIVGASGSIETWNTDNPWARSIGYDISSRYARIGNYATRIATMNLLFRKRQLRKLGF